MRLFTCALLLLFLAGCASGPRIDRSHVSANQDNRIQFVILHYTNAPQERSLQLLTHGEVSSHYLVGDNPPKIYQLVDESRRSWHAGESEWRGRTWLNSSSIGIEVVNPGFKQTPNGRIWYPYSEEQIKLLAELLKDIIKRNNIEPRNIIGHSDIAPSRKLDPGPLFPWKQLAAEGVGLWPDANAVRQQQARFASNPPSASWYQQQLARLGYAIAQTGQFDVTTQQVLAAFQMHFRPERFDGVPDAQSAAILQVLNTTK
ncbi:N-acetylmuramoyl-L-alanine amidase AmiD [compost metagenome]